MRALGFPEGHFVVAGSGIMVALGIREAYDLDIVVTQELFDVCKEDGWELRPWTKQHREGKPWLKKGNVELLLHLNNSERVFTAKDLLAEAVIVEGLPFLHPQRLIEFKRDYGRPKDLEDIVLIEQYLTKNPKVPIHP